MSIRYVTRAVVATAALSACVGCCEDRITAAAAEGLGTVAIVELEGARPAV
jgi:hypothetical protein